MIIPIFVNAETCNTENISVESIEQLKKSDNIKENSSVIGKNVNINLSMLNVGDNIEYKIMVKNDSNEDYELNKNGFNMNSDYVDYNVEFEDDSNIVKANSIKAINLKIEYKNKVPEDKFELGTKNDNNSITFNFSNGNTKRLADIIENPIAGNPLIFVVLLLITSGISFIFLKKTKYIKYMILIIGTVITIPISVYALCKYEIIIESNIVIRQTREVTFYKQWTVYKDDEDYLRVKPEDYYKYLDLYITTDENYDPKKPQLLSSDNLININSIIPEVKPIDSGYDYVPKWNDKKYWYKIIYNAPKYDENGNELHYILKENHIYGLDLFGGGPETNLGNMVFDSFDYNYNRIGITDEEREFLSIRNYNLTESNNEIPYIDHLPVIATPNKYYLYGIGEEETLFNTISTVLEGIRYIG